MPLNNSQYDAIIRNYNKKQLTARHDLDQRIQTVYEKLPEINEIDQKIASLGVGHAIKLLGGDSSALLDFKHQKDALVEKKGLLLEKNGYSYDYLMPVYSCSDCQDTGYIGSKKCHCFKQAAIEMLYTQSNMKEILEKENFDTFSFSYYNDTCKDTVTGMTALSLMKKAVAACKSFIKLFDTEYQNLFFYGSVGIGKTFLSNCIAKDLIESNHSVIYFTSYQLFELLARSTFDHQNPQENFSDIYRYIFECDLLIIDDLGTELTNSFISSQLFLVVNERNLRKKSTLISTNLSLETLIQTYSERTFSRISSNYTMLKLTGDDIRIQKKILGKSLT